MSYCYNWWSTKANQPVKGQNILGITIKIGKINIPLNMCLVSKQGRGNTDKPSCFVSMLKEILDFFDAEGVDIRKYPITFDSWYGSRKLIDILRKMGFETILIHAKNNYVMTIGKEKAKLSEHKKSIQLLPNQWGCNIKLTGFISFFLVLYQINLIRSFLIKSALRGTGTSHYKSR